jgi:pyruvate/2-oxoglutarate dehydrogenase complex dihydrolipoamide acyltransferase (E2) component
MFNTILEKLGFKHAAAAAPAPAAPSAAAAPAPAAAPAVVAMSSVDVVAKLEGLAKSAGQPLNWKTSIVDLMKLLGMDSSFNARKQLATELGCPADKMGDSAQMNMWLHKTVLAKIAENGGNVPKELLD